MNRKKTFTVFVSILAFVVICATFCIFYVQRMLFSPNFTVSEGGNEYIFVYPDYKIDDLASQMEQKQMVTDTKKIYLSARLLKMSDKRLTPGCYRVSDDMSSWQLMSKIRRGEQTPRKLVLNNIRLPEQFAQKVGSQLMVDSATVYRYVTDTAKMASLGFTPEQLFVMVVADTYEMWCNRTD